MDILRNIIDQLIIDNNLGLITPQDLRTVLIEIADRIGIEEWQPGEKYLEEQMLYVGTTLLICTDEHTSSTTPAGYDTATGLPNALISDINAGDVITLGGGGGAGGGVLLPTNRAILQTYHWVPGQSVNSGTWVDAREQQAVVTTQADLSDRSVLPLSVLAQGKLVYVRSEGLLYEYMVDPTTAQGTIDDWRPMVSGVSYAGRVGSLPLDAVNGQLYVVRMDNGGEPLNRLVVWMIRQPSMRLRS